MIRISEIVQAAVLWTVSCCWSSFTSQLGTLPCLRCLLAWERLLVLLISHLGIMTILTQPDGRDSSSGYSVRIWLYSATSAWLRSPAHHILSVVVHTYSYSTWELEAENDKKFRVIHGYDASLRLALDTWGHETLVPANKQNRAREMALCLIRVCPALPETQVWFLNTLSRSQLPVPLAPGIPMSFFGVLRHHCIHVHIPTCTQTQLYTHN